MGVKKAMQLLLEAADMINSPENLRDALCKRALEYAHEKVMAWKSRDKWKEKKRLGVSRG